MEIRYSTGTDLQRATTTPLRKALSVSGLFLVSIVFVLISAALFYLDGHRTRSYETSNAALWCLGIAVIFAVIGFPKYSKFVKERNERINAMRSTYLVLKDEIVSGLPCIKSGSTYISGKYFEISYSDISFVEALPINPNTGDCATLKLGVEGNQYYFAIDCSQEAAYAIKAKVACKTPKTFISSNNSL